MLGENAGLGDALRLRGSILLDRGEMEDGRLALIEAEALGRSAGDDDIRRMCLADLGAIAMDRGDRAEAHRLFRELRVASERVDDRFGMAIAHGNDGWAYYVEGDLDAAEREARAALGALRSDARPAFVAWALLTLASVLVARGDVEGGRAQAVEGLRLASDADSTREIAGALDVLC